MGRRALGVAHEENSQRVSFGLCLISERSPKPPDDDVDDKNDADDDDDDPTC